MNRFGSSTYLSSNAQPNYSRHLTGNTHLTSGLGNRYPVSSTGSAGRLNSNNYPTTYGSAYGYQSRSPITKTSIVATRGALYSNNSSAANRPPVTLSSRSKLPTPPPSYTEVMGTSTTSASTTAAAAAASSSMSSRMETSNSVYNVSASATACPNNQRGKVGLSNMGNTCYMNSIVQCLSHTRPLLELVLNRDDGEQQGLPSSGRVSGPFRRLLRELWSPDPVSSFARPNELRASMGRYAPRFAGYSQQDAEEFLRYLLEALHEDSNRVKSLTADGVKPSLPPINYEELDKLSDLEKSSILWKRYLSVDNSPIVDIFVGQLKSTLKCCHCGQKSTTFDPFWDLALPIPRHGRSTSLRACLELFTSHETLDGDEQPTCANCKTKRKCEKSFSLYRLPRILVIHLVRFSRERFRTKLDTLVDYPMDLDVAPFIDTDCKQSAQFGTRYSLYAVSEHSGHTPYGGHYTATVRHAYDKNKWLSCNDSRIGSSSAEAAVSSMGYVLFYEAAGGHSNGIASLEREP